MAKKEIMIFHPRKKIKALNSFFELLRYRLIYFLNDFERANLYLANSCSKSVVSKILKTYGAKIGKNCDIETGLRFHNCNDFTNLQIGDNCHIGKDCFFDLRDKVIIGENVVISMQCTFITHIDMSKSNLTKLYQPSQASITIENDAYLGSGSQVLKGVRIGEKSFVAAKSLVTKNVEPYTLVGGVPAKVIKSIKDE